MRKTWWLSTWKACQTPEEDCEKFLVVLIASHSHICMTVHSNSAQGWHAQMENHSVAVSLIHGESIHVVQAFLCAQKPAAALHPFSLQKRVFGNASVQILMSN
jgi:hypothetical protein